MKIKNYRFLLLASISLFSAYAKAQKPTIGWQNSLGNNALDYATQMQKTSDGGYIICGSKSVTNLAPSPNQFGEIFIAKLNNAGTVQWEKTMGGSQSDWATSIKQTTDGGYIVAGNSFSNNGDIGQNQGVVDGIIYKLNASGDIVWKKNLGGSDEEFISEITQTNDGNYIVTGFTASTNGDFSGLTNNGGTDAFVAKIDHLGNTLFIKNFGGAADDGLEYISALPDGNLLASGYIANENGDDDAWIIKLDATGQMIWQQTFGGDGYDYANAIKPTNDGAYVVVGSSTSTDNFPNKGEDDAFIAKFNNTGEIIWIKSFGGSGIDWFYDVQQTPDNGYVMVGGTKSNNGDITQAKGKEDVWLVKVDPWGNMAWEMNFGGSLDDSAMSVVQTNDGYVIAGYAESNDSDVLNSQDQGDAWIIKIDHSNISLSTNHISINQSQSLSPNPAQSFVTLQQQNTSDFQYQIIALGGNIIAQGQATYNQNINIEQLASGSYILQTQDQKGAVQRYKFIKK